MKNFEEIQTTLDGLNKVEIPKKCSFCNCSNEEMSKFKGNIFVIVAIKNYLNVFI